MGSLRINSGYKRLGVVLGTLAAIGAVVLSATDEAVARLSEDTLAVAIFFAVHFLTTLGIGWVHANLRNPDRAYSAGAKGVAILAPVALVAYISFLAFKIIEKQEGVPLDIALMLIFTLAVPVFSVLVVVLGLTFTIRWVGAGFLESKAGSISSGTTDLEGVEGHDDSNSQG